MKPLNAIGSAWASFALLSSLAPGSGYTAGGFPLDTIKLPPGFHISIFAEVPNARSITLSPKESGFGGNRGGDGVYAVVNAGQDGRADHVHILASGLDAPNGVAYRDGAPCCEIVSSNRAGKKLIRLAVFAGWIRREMKQEWQPLD